MEHSPPRAATGRVILSGTGPLAAAVLGGLLLAGGLQFKGSYVLTWFIPVVDLGAVICLLATMALATLDVNLRADSRSLPIVGLGAAATVAWLGHLVSFPGVFPGLAGAFMSEWTSWIFLLLNLAMPFLVAIVLLQPARTLGNPPIALAISGGLGLLAGLGLLGTAALLAGLHLETVRGNGSFSWIASAVGVLGLLPALLALVVFRRGRRGDLRIAGGVLAALLFCVLTSISLVFLRTRFSPQWYSIHVLSFLPAAAFLLGQLGLYRDSVRAEQEARAEADEVAEELRAGFELAVEMANQVEVTALILRLITGAAEIVGADRGGLVRVEDGEIVVEGSFDRSRTPAPVGARFPIDVLAMDGRSVVRDVVERRRPALGGTYRLDVLEERHASALQDVRHTLCLPLMLRGEVLAVLVLSRRADAPFEQRDIHRLGSFALMAALLLRNVRLLAEAQEASTTKSRFLNMAAHELRTPLSVINGYVDMVLSGVMGELDAPQENALRIVAGKSGELGEHVERLLIASRLEDRRRAAAAAVVDLAEAVEAAVARARPRADLRKAELRLEHPGHPLAVRAAEEDVRIILDNLINNALTYSADPAQVVVAVSEGKLLEVRVSDNGIGIPEEERERVFEQFHRVDNPDFGYPPGTGLGLNIGRRLAELHGGSLVVESSEPGKGTVLLLRLQPAQTRASSSM